MIYRELAPSPRLAAWVRCFWFLRAEVAAGPQPIVPDGCLELVLHLSTPFREVGPGGAVLQPPSLLVGQMTRPLTVLSNEAADVVGVRFHPAGARAFLGAPVGSFTGRVWPLEDVAPRLAAGLATGLTELSSPSARVAALEERLARSLEPRTLPDQRVVAAVEVLARAPGLDVGELARRLGTSLRQLERGFARDVGLGPRFFGRLQRFQRAWRAFEAADGRASWAAVAARCGYADQAHLIRQFHQFAGEAPARFSAREHELADRIAGIRAKPHNLHANRTDRR